MLHIFRGRSLDYSFSQTVERATWPGDSFVFIKIPFPKGKTGAPLGSPEMEF